MIEFRLRDHDFDGGGVLVDRLEQGSVINEIECGKAKYNAQQIVKIKRILKIK